MNSDSLDTVLTLAMVVVALVLWAAFFAEAGDQIAAKLNAMYDLGPLR